MKPLCHENTIELLTSLQIKDTPLKFAIEAAPRVCGISNIHIRAISQDMPQPAISKIRFKITYLNFHSNFPGANELIPIYGRWTSISHFSFTNIVHFSSNTVM